MNWRQSAQNVIRVTGTRAVTDRYVKPPVQSHAQPRPVAVAAPDDLEAGE